MKSSDIHIMAISQGMPQPAITKIRLKITYIEFHSNFLGANELISCIDLTRMIGYQKSTPSDDH